MLEVLYFGDSMRPLFRPGDSLLLETCDSGEIRPGDVVVFPHPRTGKRVVHRVLAVKKEGLTTKGDNSLTPDGWTISPGEVVGRVVAVRRQGRLLPVPRREPLSQPWFHAGRRLDRVLSRWLHPLYHRLAGSRLLKDRWPNWLKPRLLCFARPEGEEWQLWLGSLLIGRRQPRQGEWSIRRPFRLLLDPATLPGKTESEVFR